MDRLTELAAELSHVLDELHDEAAARGGDHLMVPISWLDEASGWLRHEIAQAEGRVPRDPVPFTYVEVGARR